MQPNCSIHGCSSGGTAAWAVSGPPSQSVSSDSTTVAPWRGARCVASVQRVPRPAAVPPLVTLHLFGVGPSRVPAALVRMGLDRRHLATTPGCWFWKLLGTGNGRTFRPRDADPLRWGLLAVWSSAADLAAFERSSPVISGWGRITRERWRAELVPVRARGSWSGRQPFSPLAPAGGPSGSPGPVAAITRARLAPAKARTFWRAVPPVSADLRSAAGLRFAIGIGEAPIGLQGTFSVWDDAAALTAYAYAGAAHREAVDRTPEQGWYAEECFARFRVLATTGTIGGRDPAGA